MAGGGTAGGGDAEDAATLGGPGVGPGNCELTSAAASEEFEEMPAAKLRRAVSGKEAAPAVPVAKAGKVGAKRAAPKASGGRKAGAAKTARAAKAGRTGRTVLVAQMGPNGPQLRADSGQPRWNAEKRERFLEHLAATGNVLASSEAAGMSKKSAYRERKRNDAFRAAWSTAIESGYSVLEAAVLARLIEGVDKPVIRGGEEVAVLREYRDDVALRLLAAHRETAMCERERQAEAAGAEERRRKRAGFEIKFATLRGQLLTDEAGE